jgi:hypothetical protein
MYALMTVRRELSDVVGKLTRSSPEGHRISKLLIPELPRRPLAGEIIFPARRNNQFNFDVTTLEQVITRAHDQGQKWRIESRAGGGGEWRVLLFHVHSLSCPRAHVFNPLTGQRH